MSLLFPYMLILCYLYVHNKRYVPLAYVALDMFEGLEVMLGGAKDP